MRRQNEKYERQTAVCEIGILENCKILEMGIDPLVISNDK